MKRILIPLLLLILVISTSGCLPADSTENTDDINQNETSQTDATQPENPPDEFTDEDAVVKDFEILFLESFPLQVMVSISGTLRDGCTTLTGTEVEKPDENTFVIHLLTERDEEAACIQSLVPFDENVSLDVYGLPKGDYTVKVQFIEKTFTFETDNSIPD